MSREEVPRCRVAQLTAPGRAALATLHVEGPGATELVDHLFRAEAGRPLSSFDCGRVLFGRWRLAATVLEEVVVCRHRPDTFEVHCHGGLAASRAVIESLEELGAERIAGQQWIELHAATPIRAAAWQSLTLATTRRAAGVLLDQFHGALDREVTEILKLLHGSELVTAAQRLATLERHGQLGIHLVRPWRVVVAGRANVGKSSLVNALLGFERTIVFGQPGTTRDAVATRTALDGWPLELIDTAGIRPSADAVEAAGIRRTRRQMAAADLILFIDEVGPTARATIAQPKVAKATPDKGVSRDVVRSRSSLPNIRAQPALVPNEGSQENNCIQVLNKCDLLPQPPPPRSGAFLVSARTGYGLEALVCEIVARLVPDPPQPGQAVPFTSEQCAAIRLAVECCRRNDCTAALAALRALPADPSHMAPDSADSA